MLQQFTRRAIFIAGAGYSPVAVSGPAAVVSDIRYKFN